MSSKTNIIFIFKLRLDSAECSKTYVQHNQKSIVWPRNATAWSTMMSRDAWCSQRCCRSFQHEICFSVTQRESAWTDSSPWNPVLGVLGVLYIKHNAKCWSNSAGQAAYWVMFPASAVPCVSPSHKILCYSLPLITPSPSPPVWLWPQSPKSIKTPPPPSHWPSRFWPSPFHSKWDPWNMTWFLPLALQQDSEQKGWVYSALLTQGLFYCTPCLWCYIG